VSSFSQFYQAIFDSKDWSGHLLARPISDGAGNLSCTTEARGELCPPAWDAACALTGGSCVATGISTTAPDWNTGRDLLTYNGTDGAPFRWVDLTVAQQTALQDGGTTTDGQNRLNFLRGDRSQEQQNSGVFRNRENLLGDIVHSGPTYVGPPDKDYPADASWIDLLGGVMPENSAVTQYGSFQSTNHTRLNVVYVGSNDGIVHGFRSGSFDVDNSFINVQNDGREVLAYVPTHAYDYLARLSDPNYRTAGLHKYFADGKMEATDAYFNGSWRTVLVGGLGAGGQGIFALDVTDPSSFDESNASSLVLWEFSDAYDDGTYSGDDLGYTFGQPHTVRLHNGKWGVLVGNGYNNTFADGDVSTTGNAVLYVLDVETGSVMAKLDTGIGVSASYSGGKPNGLADVTPIDLDGDVVTDYVYAGDLFGNVWRFDLTDTSESNWAVDDFDSGTIRPLFVASDSNGTPKRQPITTKVLVDDHPLGRIYGVMVYVGTGKYFEDSDNVADTSTEHSMYGVWDAHFPDFSNVATYGTPAVAYDITRGNLQPQTIQYDFFNPVHGERQRILSENAVNWSTQVGWYVDLLAGNSTYDDNSTPADSSDDTVTAVTTHTREGEMIAANPVIIGDTIVASTIIPNPDACSSGGDGWIMVFNKLTGGRLGYAPFYKSVDSKPIQGIKVVGSTVGSPTFVSKQLLLPLGDTSLGEGGVTRMPFRVRGEGRQNWRELR
jgi:type IV pilus assembly protein PilY1